MWPFPRKPVNRRLGRRHMLEVKARADVLRAARLRFGALGTGILLCTVLGIYGVWRAAEWATDRFLTGNDAFAIRQIEVQTDGAISAEQIRRWAGVRMGLNLLALDLSRVKRDLELVPNIKTATVERVLRHGLRIRVLEREPLAQVHLPEVRASGAYEPAVLYLDEDAVVMPPLAARQRATPPPQPPPVYPLITGVDFGQLCPGRQLDQPQVRAALQLIIAFGRSPMVGLDDLEQIDVSAPETLQVRTAQGTEVTFATRDLDRQLRRWRQIVDLGRQMQKTLATLDLAVSNNIPVRWLEASSQPLAPPKDAPPARLRKKTVSATPSPAVGAGLPTPAADLRSPKEIRKRKSESGRSAVSLFRATDFGPVSDFGFRLSDFLTACRSAINLHPHHV